MVVTETMVPSLVLQLLPLPCGSRLFGFSTEGMCKMKTISNETFPFLLSYSYSVVERIQLLKMSQFLCTIDLVTGSEMIYRSPYLGCTYYVTYETNRQTVYAAEHHQLRSSETRRMSISNHNTTCNIHVY